MSLLFCDSFDHYATADVTTKWSTIIENGTGTATITAAAARTGTQGLQCSAVGINDCDYPTVTVAAATASGVCGFAVRLSAGAWSGFNPGDATNGTALIEVIDAGVDQMALRINGDGTLSVMRGTAATASGLGILGSTSAALPSSGWTFVEFKWTISDTVGAAEVRFDGTTVLSLSGVDTKPFTSATWGTIGFGRVSGASGTNTIDLDDFYLCDTSGSVNNDFLGDIRVDCHYPNAVGNSSGWTRSTGADQWATVDDPTMNSDTDYNSITAVNTVDTLNFPALTNIGADIDAVQVCVTARKTAAGGGSVASVVRHSSTDYAATGQGCSVTYGTQRFVHETNPGTAVAWTESDFNSAEFGYKKTA